MGRMRLPGVVFQPWLGALVLSLGVLLEWHRWHYGLYAILEPIYGLAFALLLGAALRRERDRDGWLVGRYFARIGLYSYSLYLLHRPIQLAREPLARHLATWPFVVEHGIPSSLLIWRRRPIVLWASRLFCPYRGLQLVIAAPQSGGRSMLYDVDARR